MKKFLRNIKRLLLAIPLRRPSPDRIPRSGEAGMAVNCYTTLVTRTEAGPLIVKSANGDVLECLEYDGDRYSIEKEFKFDDLLNEKFEFRHYHGLATTTYTGWLDLALGHIFRVPYIKVWLYYKRDGIAQGLYNRRKLVTKDRIEILQAILNAQLNGKDKLSSLTVMSIFHSDRWFLHPNKDAEHSKIKLYLDALVETNELRISDFDYQITGHGIAAIELYEEQERKHSESISSQRRMFWLTIVIALLTVVQAGLIKLPPIIDLVDR